jgi:hypothetical protein
MGPWANSSGRRSTSIMEVSIVGSYQAAESHLGDAGKDAFPGEPPVWQREQIQRFWVEIA